MLLLPNGERLNITPNTKLIFESENLEFASPSIISRCGILWVEQESLDYRDLIKEYMDENLSGYLAKEWIDHAKKWIVIALARGLPYIEKCKTILPLNPPHMALQFAKIVKLIIQSEKNLDVLDERGPVFTRKSIEKLVMFSYYWAFGSMLTVEYLPRFER